MEGLECRKGHSPEESCSGRRDFFHRSISERRDNERIEYQALFNNANSFGPAANDSLVQEVCTSDVLEEIIITAERPWPLLRMSQ